MDTNRTFNIVVTLVGVLLIALCVALAPYEYEKTHQEEIILEQLEEEPGIANEAAEYLVRVNEVKFIKYVNEAHWVNYYVTMDNAKTVVGHKATRAWLCELGKILSEKGNGQDIMLSVVNDKDYEHILYMVLNGTEDFYWRDKGNKK